MMFLLEMMFACALIIMTTTAVTIFVMLLLGWVLATGQEFDRAHASADESVGGEAQASRVW